MKLLKKQEHCVFHLKNKEITEVLYGGAAGGAKSVMGCLWIIEMCLTYPDSRWLIGRAKLKTLKETTINTFFEIAAKLGITEQFKYNKIDSQINWTNGSQILLKDLFHYPSDPNYDSLGSLEICGAFIDECNQIQYKAWQIVLSRCRYKLKEFGITPKILGTCNPAKNWTYSKFYKPDKENKLPSNRAFVQALPKDNPHLPESYLKTLLSLDDNSKQRLYYGNWEYDDDPSALVDYEAIMDMFTNDHVPETGKKAITADLAMQGRDRFVAFSWSGLVARLGINKPKATGRSIELDLKQLKVDFGVGNSQIIADSDGLGGYLESYIKNIKTFHGNGKPRNKKEFVNIKDECGFKLAELINKREIKIICNPSLVDTIAEEIAASLKRDNLYKDISKKKLIGKDKVKENIQRSPDYFDAILMRMLTELKTKKYTK